MEQHEQEDATLDAANRLFRKHGFQHIKRSTILKEAGINSKNTQQYLPQGNTFEIARDVNQMIQKIKIASQLSWENPKIYQFHDQPLWILVQEIDYIRNQEVHTYIKDWDGMLRMLDDVVRYHNDPKDKYRNEFSAWYQWYQNWIITMLKKGGIDDDDAVEIGERIYEKLLGATLRTWTQNLPLAKLQSDLDQLHTYVYQVWKEQAGLDDSQFGPEMYWQHYEDPELWDFRDGFWYAKDA